MVKLPNARLVVSPGLGRGGVSWTPQAASAGRGQGAALGYLPLVLGPAAACLSFAVALELLPQSFHLPSPAVKSDDSKSLFSSFSGMSLISQVICDLMAN